MVTIIIIALLILTAARAEAARAGRVMSARLHRKRLILHADAGGRGRHRHVPVGMDCVGLLLLAKWPRAALAFAPAPSSVSRIPDASHARRSPRPPIDMKPLGNALSSSYERFRERLERAIASGEEHAPAKRL